MRKVKLLLSGVSGMVILLACGCGVGGKAGEQLAKELVSIITDAAGNAITTRLNEETHPTLLCRLAGLPPNQATEIMLYRDGRPVYRDAQGNPRPIILTTNEKGEIPTAALFYDLGIDPQSGRPIPPAGNYTVRIMGVGVDRVIPLTVGSRGSRQESTEPPTIWVMKSARQFAMGSVPEGEPVYAHGINFPPNRKVRLYVVRDRRDWQAGDPLEDVTGAIEEVMTDSNGTIDFVMVWPAAHPVDGNRDFDLIADVADADGKFDSHYTPNADAIDADLTTGFTVQSLPKLGERVKLASDPDGNYKTAFTTDESVTIWVNPPWRPLAPYMMVKKYICPHKDKWNYGDRLVDVTGRTEWDLVRYACSNQYLCVVWAPPLTPGKYDPVIDVNQNDVYDEGDILGEPFEVIGPKPKRLFLSAQFPAIDPSGSTPITAVLISEKDTPIPKATVQFSVADADSSIEPTSAETNDQGQASATLKVGSTGGKTITVTATATAEGVTVTGQTQVQVRAYGSINAIIRGRLWR